MQGASRNMQFIRGQSLVVRTQVPVPLMIMAGERSGENFSDKEAVGGT
jgi:hypothetical protein